MVGDVYITCRKHFEVIKEPNNDMTIPYSELRVYPDGISISDIGSIVTAYFSGIKQSIFVSREEEVKQIVQNISNKFDDEGLYLKGRNFIINSNKKMK